MTAAQPNAYAPVERNLRAAFRMYSRATPEGEIRTLPGLILINSGMPLGVFNSMLLTEPATLPEFTKRLAMADVHYRARGMPWSLWLCEDMLDRSVRRTARQYLLENRFTLTSEPAGMIASRLLPSQRALPEITVLPTTQKRARFDFCDVAATVFHLSYPTSRQIYGQEEVWQEQAQGFVAYAEGVPVSTLVSVACEEALGFYSVATLPQYRRRGYAETLLRHVTALQHRPGDPLVLQATRAGKHLYEQLGFTAVSRFGVYVAP